MFQKEILFIWSQIITLKRDYHPQMCKNKSKGTEEISLTNLYFVRHAHSAYSTDEIGRPLSEKGISDATKVTDLLKQEGIDIVISSPYKRAIQTVEGTAQCIEKPIEIVEGFKERILTIQPAEDFTQAITKVWEDENFFWEGGESNLTAQY